MKGSKVLVIGLARTGLSTAKLLKSKGALVDGYDLKQLEIDVVQKENSFANVFVGGDEPVDLDYNLCIIAPGVPPEKGFAKKVIDSGIEVISEIELCARFVKGKVVAITGTNGKTTTTAWLADVFKTAGKKAYACGNIGLPFSEVLVNFDDEDVYYILELSSYQLERTFSLQPIAATILNVTEDHLQRHKTMENYTTIKKKIYMNVENLSSVVLNLDNDITKSISEESTAFTTFSLEDTSASYYLQDGYLVNAKQNHAKVIHRDEIFLKGDHNIENALTVLAVADICKIAETAIKKSLSDFHGVEHRNEFVGVVGGVKCYNDSKATNPEASIPAIRSIDGDIVLIAGGMDKGNSYDEWIGEFKHVKTVILFGETKLAIKDAMLKNGKSNFYVVDDLKSAVDKAKQIVEKGDNLLLSPACASWDMYESFEHRGREFKDLIYDWRDEIEKG